MSNKTLRINHYTIREISPSIHLPGKGITLGAIYSFRAIIEENEKEQFCWIQQCTDSATGEFIEYTSPYFTSIEELDSNIIDFIRGIGFEVI